jgi:hypothetical protein
MLYMQRLLAVQRLVRKVLRAPKDLPELMVLKVHKVLQDLKAKQARQVPMELQ